MKKQNGFTLIELLITCTIVAILAALAVPVYRDYVVRARVSEGIALMGPVKIQVSEYAISNGELPTEFTTGVSGRYVRSIEMTEGVVVIVFKGSAKEPLGDESANTLTLVPRLLPSSMVTWTCGGEGTTIPPRYLPASCRT